MTNEELAALRKAAEGATPGRWHVTDHGWTVWRTEPDGSRFIAAATAPNSHDEHRRGHADATYIAAAYRCS